MIQDSLIAAIEAIVTKYEDGQNHDEGAFDADCSLCQILSDLRTALHATEISKPVMLCRCGKMLETPRDYAAHCKEFPDHFTRIDADRSKPIGFDDAEQGMEP